MWKDGSRLQNADQQIVILIFKGRAGALERRRGTQSLIFGGLNDGRDVMRIDPVVPERRPGFIIFLTG